MRYFCFDMFWYLYSHLTGLCNAYPTRQIRRNTNFVYVEIHMMQMYQAFGRGAE